MSFNQACQRLYSDKVSKAVNFGPISNFARSLQAAPLNTLEITLLQKFLLTFWDGEAPVEWNSVICPWNVRLHFLFLLSSVGCCSLWLSAIIDIPEYSALSEAIVKMTGEGMGKNCKSPQSDKVETNHFNF